MELVALEGSARRGRAAYSVGIHVWGVMFVVVVADGACGVFVLVCGVVNARANVCNES